jgi:hypothetical protein
MSRFTVIVARADIGKHTDLNGSMAASAGLLKREATQNGRIPVGIRFHYPTPLE